MTTIDDILKEFTGTKEDLEYIVLAVIEDKDTKAIKRHRLLGSVKESKKYIARLHKYNKRLLYEGLERVE